MYSKKRCIFEHALVKGAWEQKSYSFENSHVNWLRYRCEGLEAKIL